MAPNDAPMIHAYPPPPPRLAKKSSKPNTKILGSVKDIFVGVTPFVITMLLFIIFITFFPNVVTWLPNLLFN